MRDVLTVECSKINGKDFKGTITYTEATVKIYQDKFGLQADNLHSIKMSFSTCRVVSFKLRSQINIDEMAEKEAFTIERCFMEGDEIKRHEITCKLTEIRKPIGTPELRRPDYQGSVNDTESTWNFEQFN